MSWDEDDDDRSYQVVINHEEQYSIWPEGREPPAGWRAVGVTGNRSECLSHIDEVWTDMRPLSLRRWLEEQAKNPPPAEAIADVPTCPSLVERLSEGDHPIEASLKPEKTLPALRQRLESGFLHVKFTDTRGGTDLMVALDTPAAAGVDAALDSATGLLRLEGRLNLDFVPCRFVGNLDLNTLTGLGRLEPLPLEGSFEPQVAVS